MFLAGSITRSCSKAAINDCRVDNGITYCYCKNDACNNPDRKLDDPAPDQLLGGFDSQKTHKIRGKRPSSGKLISIEAGLSDDEDMRIVHKNRKTVVHHSGRPDNEEEGDEGSGDYNYDDGEMYYSESDESYPTDYSDTTDRTDTGDLIIEETNSYGGEVSSINKILGNRRDDINFDEEYGGRHKLKFPIDSKIDRSSKDSENKIQRTSGADSLVKGSTECFVVSISLLLLSLFQ